ncbi:hypothetical protein CR194_00765 [Salipaludibacillus keqinensis]|uniref:Uncharacterized protein n=1 Tax=Salipaludibacillus keqinensis TaxID=2045207 RepID=A0A323TKC1_9BACI|nr:sporulation YhaL family protein [Salipaludibacillus keqinensis]PYZ94107.1 hypothetical protein CR194_00765 [Salipaludibacillus keqinensis]
MNAVTVVLTLIGAVFLAFVIRLLSLTSISEYVHSHPWWVYLVMIGIVASGFFTAIHWIKDKQQENGSPKSISLGAKIFR